MIEWDGCWFSVRDDDASMIDAGSCVVVCGRLWVHPAAAEPTKQLRSTEGLLGDDEDLYGGVDALANEDDLGDAIFLNVGCGGKTSHEITNTKEIVLIRGHDIAMVQVQDANL